MTKDETFLEQARNRWKIAEEAEKEQRARELADLRFYAGEQWDDDLLKSRNGTTLGSGTNAQVVPARPSLTINKTLEPVRQILNQQRQADLGYELVPADDFGEVTGPIDHSEIELREGLVRRIQRDPEAEDARMWSFQRAAIAGTGYRVVMTRYLPGKRADQEVFIQRIFNQNSVLLDPSREQPDASDAAWGFYGADVFWTTFKGEYPKAKVSKIESDDQWRALGDEAPGWFSPDSDKDKRTLRVTNYYHTVFETETLYHLTNGSAVTKEELAAALASGLQQELDSDNQPVTHDNTAKKIKWAKLVGNEVLEQTDWPGQWIPIIQEVGEELLPYDGERRKQGVVRPMRDSCKGNNYIISKFVERVGLTPIPPVIMAGGQDEGYEDEWNAANTRTFGRLRYNLKDSEGQLVPHPPMRLDVRAEISDIAAGVQMFGQAIQATSVVPETALGNTDSSVKSAKLARALIEQAEMGTSNFMDNHKRSLRHEARIVNDLLYPIYGRPGRLARIINGQGDVESIIIGQPFTVQGEGPQRTPVPIQQAEGQPLPPNAKQYKLTKDANFNVAVKISKSIETRRQQIVQFLAEWIGAAPEQIAVMGDLVWKYLDVPEHQEIEKRQRLMLAPPIQQMLSGDTPLSPEAQQKIAMLEAQIRELLPLADKNKSDLIKTEMQQKADNDRTAAEVASREKIERWKIEAQLEIEMAKLGNASMMKRAEIDADLLHQHNDRQMAEQERAEQAASDAALSAQEHAQAKDQAEQGQDHALEQGMQGQMNTLEQGEQAHAQALEQQAAQPQPPV